MLVTPLSGVSGRMLVRPAGPIVGDLSDPGTRREAETRARALLCEPDPRSGPESVGDAEVFFEISQPAPVLTIFGAGHDAVPLARQAWAMGLDVTVVDPREALLTAERFPKALLVPAHHSQWAEALSLPDHSFVVVMNHHIERDRESLRFALCADAAYIGVLGPRVRYQKLLSGLAAEGFVPDSAEALARAKPGRPLARRGNTRRSGRINRRRNPGASPGLRGGVLEWNGEEPSPAGRGHAAAGAFVILRRVDIQ